MYSEMMSNYLSMMDIFLVIKKRWLAIAASTVAGLIVFAVFSVFLITPKYTTSVDTYVYSNIRLDADGNPVPGSTVTLSELNAASRLVNAYIVMLSNRVALKRVADRLSVDMTLGQLRSAIAMSSINETEILRIAVTTEDPKLSAEICNSMAAVAPDFLAEHSKGGGMIVIGEAAVPSVPSSPNVKLNAVLGALIGLLLSAGLAILLFVIDNTIKGEEDLKMRFDVPVLGEIPNLDAVMVGGAGHV